MMAKIKNLKRKPLNAEDSKNKDFTTFTMTNRINLKILLAFVLLLQISGCVSEEVDEIDIITFYQKEVVDKGPQHRDSNEGLDSLRPTSEPNMFVLEVTKDKTTDRNIIELSLDDAVKRALISSPEISVVSYDPSIAKENIIKAVSDFDVALFGRVNYEKQDDPTDSLFLGGQATSRVLETGLKQKGITGAEWSLAYALTRNWDDLTTRTLSTRYEPMLSFQIKQPLLRDAWQELNLAGINISKLNYRIALATFRQKTEEVSADVISLYWMLLQARRDLEIQQWLLNKTLETLRKVEDRRDIDATTVQIKQAESAQKSREAILFQVEKRVVDIQDALVRLLSDHQFNLLNDFEIVPTSVPNMTERKIEQSETLELAMANNSVIQQARLGVEVAQINVDVAKKQKMPRLDLVASTRMQGLSRTQGDAQDIFNNADYVSYALGITAEIPLGNRQREAEFRKRRFEHRKAISMLQNISDQLAAQVKERIRLVETSYEEIPVQKDAVKAAEIHLQALEDTEVIRDKLTPEFLLVKLQAQESLANSQRAEIKAITNYNTSQVRLAQATGTVLDMRYVRQALPKESEHYRLKNENMKYFLLNKIIAVQQMIDEGLYEDALSMLENDILQKTNGCAETGQPDKNDWIVTCEEQNKLYPIVIETIERVNSIIEKWPDKDSSTESQQ
ncbi:MAG: TolC family protein [Planctomycetota bacterium]|jgi:outer membrane protein TolC